MRERYCAQYWKMIDRPFNCLAEFFLDDVHCADVYREKNSARMVRTNERVVDKNDDRHSKQ